MSSFYRNISNKPAVEQDSQQELKKLSSISLDSTDIFNHIKSITEIANIRDSVYCKTYSWWSISDATSCKLNGSVYYINESWQ
jgi:hypothetical protein